MQLSVATNWDENLIPEVANYPIQEFYASLPKTPVGGGRPSRILPNVSKDKVAAHINEAHRRGIRFNYVINSTCLGLRPNDESAMRRVLDHVGWLVELGVDGVTVANPYVLDLVRRHHPKLPIKVSIFSNIDGIAKAMQYVDLGATGIVLSLMENRNFRFLEAARRSLKCDLSLLVNQGCLYRCPYRVLHGNTVAHASTDEENGDSSSVMYCLARCSLDKLRNPELLMRSPWIRPEDLQVYEELGYDTFKIAGREKSTPWLRAAVAAYTERVYVGNLLDIINGVTVFEAMPPRKGVPALVAPEIDNQALDGFLSHFRNGHCRTRCQTCGHCARAAERAANAHADENNTLLGILEGFTESFAAV